MADKLAPFRWPLGKRAALSITFDDAQESQVDVAMPILRKFGLTGTFYVNTGPKLDARIDGWRKAVADGNEIGNHTVTHPCTGNFDWSRANALEDYTLERMAGEIDACNQAVQEKLGVTPQTFAYPCGQTYVGRGENLQTYIPLVARQFIACRAYNTETLPVPTFVDLSHVDSVGIDGATVDAVMVRVQQAMEHGSWLIVVGHCVGPDWAIRESTLTELCRLGADSAGGVWVDTVANVAKHIIRNR